jgi:hypothetical protein
VGGDLIHGSHGVQPNAMLDTLHEANHRKKPSKHHRKLQKLNKSIHTK